jgi:hypothetical protein
LFSALQSCPYPALVEFNTRHGRTLLTLAERSLEAALAAGGGSGGSSSGSGSSTTSGLSGSQTKRRMVAGQLATCLCRCLGAGQAARVSAVGSSSCEAKCG